MIPAYWIPICVAAYLFGHFVLSPFILRLKKQYKQRKEQKREAQKYLTPAYWKNDCQGKKDYDANIIVLSTRYWPGSYQANGLCSAKSTFSIEFRKPGDTEPGEAPDFDSEVLAEQEFEGRTESEVKAQVEAWTQYRMQCIAMTLKREFGV